MIKKLGEGSGQDGSCVRSDRADVVALGVRIVTLPRRARHRTALRDAELVKERRADPSETLR